MGKIYGMARVSTKHQKLDRQITNILSAYPNAIIVREHYTGTTSNRPQWTRLKAAVTAQDTIVFDSVSRMSRNAEEGFSDYKELFEKGVSLVFLKEPHINTSVFQQSLQQAIHIDVSTGNGAIDEYFSGNIDLINRLLMRLAEQQIQLAFQQSEKEVTDLHARISEGMRESAKRGTRIGLEKGRVLTTKKSVECKQIIAKHSIAFGGSLSDAEVIRLCGCSRNSYYKYKKELSMQQVI